MTSPTLAAIPFLPTSPIPSFPTNAFSGPAGIYTPTATQLLTAPGYPGTLSPGSHGSSFFPVEATTFPGSDVPNPGGAASPSGGRHASSGMLVGTAAGGATAFVAMIIFAVLYLRYRRKLKSGGAEKQPGDSRPASPRLSTQPTNIHIQTTDFVATYSPMRSPRSALDLTPAPSPTPSSTVLQRSPELVPKDTSSAAPLSWNSHSTYMSEGSPLMPTSEAQLRFSAIPSELHTVCETATRASTHLQHGSIYGSPPPVPIIPRRRPLPERPATAISDRQLQRLTGSEWSHLPTPPPPYANGLAEPMPDDFAWKIEAVLCQQNRSDAGTPLSWNGMPTPLPSRPRPNIPGQVSDATS